MVTPLERCKPLKSMLFTCQVVRGFGLSLRSESGRHIAGLSKASTGPDPVKIRPAPGKLEKYDQALGASKSCGSRGVATCGTPPTHRQCDDSALRFDTRVLPLCPSSAHTLDDLKLPCQDRLFLAAVRRASPVEDIKPRPSLGNGLQGSAGLD